MSAAQPTDDTRWLDEAEQQAWRHYLRGHRLLELALERALEAEDLSLSEYEIIAMLSEAPRTRMRMSELADIVTQSRSRLTHTASRLEQRGWVQRVPFERDRRGVQLCLTDLGRQRLESAARVHVESVRECLIEPLPRHLFEALGEAMGLIEESLRGRGREE